jgi:hypothetical protein
VILRVRKMHVTLMLTKKLEDLKMLQKVGYYLSPDSAALPEVYYIILCFAQFIKAFVFVTLGIPRANIKCN